MIGKDRQMYTKKPKPQTLQKVEIGITNKKTMKHENEWQIREIEKRLVPH